MCLALPKSVCRAIPPAPGRRTTNGENQITNIGGNAVTYDSNGNLTKDDHGDTLVYDAWNRLVAVYASNGILLKGYTYDGNGRMTSETNVTTTTDLYYSGTQDIEKRTGVTDDTGASLSSNGSIAYVSIYSPDYTNDILLRDTYSGGDYSYRTFFTHDANYNVTGLSVTAASIAQRMVYDAYGKVSFYGSSWGGPGNDTYGLRNLYQGVRYDPSIGWYFTGESNVARWYSPTMDVWNREDSAGDVNGLNEYGFVADNPIDECDPTGLFISAWHASITRSVGTAEDVDPAALANITGSDVAVDGVHISDPQFHAQERGWEAVVGDQLSKVQHAACSTSMQNLALWIGTALHVMQDFFSHTDWLDGTDLNPVYKEYNTIRGALPMVLVAHAPHHETVPIYEVVAGDKYYENVTYFTGGVPATNDDLHNRYAADDERVGRDLHHINGIGGATPPVGLAGAFNEAIRYATEESEEIFQWVKLNIPCCLYRKIFTDYQMLPSSGSRGEQA